MNRRKLTVDEGTTILEAARDAGIYIPTLCYHPALEPIGACRLCMVELTSGKRTGHVAACVTPVVDGSVVQTDTPDVRRMRSTVLKLLMARCPGLGVLEDLAARLGVDDTPYPLEEEICFLCGVCVRACREIVGVEAIGFADRGVRSEVLPPFAIPSARCVSCGVCTTVCPARTFDLSKVSAPRTMHQEGEDPRTSKCAVCDEHYSGP